MTFSKTVKISKEELIVRRYSGFWLLLMGIVLAFLSYDLFGRRSLADAPTVLYIASCLGIGCAANKEVTGVSGNTDIQNDIMLYASFIGLGFGFVSLAVVLPMIAGIIISVLLVIKGMWFYIESTMSCYPIPYACTRSACTLTIAGLTMTAAVITHTALI